MEKAKDDPALRLILFVLGLFGVIIALMLTAYCWGRSDGTPGVVFFGATAVIFGFFVVRRYRRG